MYGSLTIEDASGNVTGQAPGNSFGLEGPDSPEWMVDKPGSPLIKPVSVHIKSPAVVGTIWNITDWASVMAWGYYGKWFHYWGSGYLKVVAGHGGHAKYCHVKWDAAPTAVTQANWVGEDNPNAGS